MESTSTPAAPSRLLTLFCVFFFASGACGLAYEILWTRLFGLAIGNVAVTLSAVLTAFMGGLALGSALAGRLWPRVRNPLAAYGALELGIAATVLAVPALIQLSHAPLALVYRTEGLGPYAQHLARFVTAGAIMIVPTTLMGATLPMLIGYFARTRQEVGRRAGLLYAVNTFGAMAGAMATGLYLIPRAGMSRILWGAAGVNALIGLMALAASRLEAAPHGPAEPAAAPEGKMPAASPGEASAALARICVASIGLSGAASMLLQVAWTRLFAVTVGSSTYSFTLVVTATIGSLALGAHLFGSMADRSSHRAALLAALLFVAGVLVFATIDLANELPLVVYRLIGRAQDRPVWILVQEFCVIGLFLFGTTLCLGGAFPVVARIAAGRSATVAKAVGTVYAVNTVGAVAGSAMAGLVLMPLLTLNGCFKLGAGALMGLGALVALAALRRRWQGMLCAGAMAAVFGVALYGSPPWNLLLLNSGAFRQQHAPPNLLDVPADEVFRKSLLNNALLFHREGLACTVTVVQTNRPDRLALKVNGKADASNTKTDMPTQLLVGHLACLFHPRPKDGCVIGLGGGYSLGCMEAHPLERIDCVEISKDVVEAVRLWFEPYNGHALEDPRARIIIADARNHLALTDRTYDVIVSEPSNPWIAGVGNLFTTEFFRLAQSRLNPGGILGQWIHTYTMGASDVLRVIGSFADVFAPNVIVWQCTPGDYILLGSNRPLRLNAEQLMARLADPKIGASLGRLSLNNFRTLLSGYVGPVEAFAEAIQRVPRNTDDYPRLEFSAPTFLYRADVVDPWDPTPFWSPIEPLFQGSTIPQEHRAWMAGHVSRKRRFGEAAQLFAKDEAGEGTVVMLDILREDPDDLTILTSGVEMLDGLGVSLARNDEPEAARKILEVAARLAKERANALNDDDLLERVCENLARLRLETNHPDQALEEYSQLFAAGKGSVQARQAAAAVFVDRGQAGRAWPIVLDGLPAADVVQRENLLRLAAYAAVVLGIPGALDPALPNERKQSPPPRDSQPLAAALALNEAVKSKTPPSAGQARDAIASSPDDPRGAAVIGEAFRLAGQTPAARSIFEAVLKAEAGNAAALLGLAEMDLQGGPADAEGARKALLRIHPPAIDTPRLPFLMALAAESGGDLAEARRQLGEAQKRLAALPEAVARQWSGAEQLNALRERIGK